MSSFSRELSAVARLDLAEILRSRWMIFTGLVYVSLGAVFVFVGMRESMVIGFSGMGRALLSMVHTLLLILPLLGLTATGQTINRARDDGTLELLFSHPVRRTSYFLAISLTRYLVLAAPLCLLLLGMALLGRFGFDQEINWGFLVQSMIISAALLCAYVGAGVAVSTFVRDQARAVIWLLVLWALGALLLDFGLVAAMLEWQLPPRAVFLLASLNPVQCARMALLSGASSELAVLGPVGFYLSNQVGPAALYALGVAWPVALGAATWGGAMWSFRRADIV